MFADTFEQVYLNTLDMDNDVRKVELAKVINQYDYTTEPPFGDPELLKLINKIKMSPRSKNDLAWKYILNYKIDDRDYEDVSPKVDDEINLAVMKANFSEGQCCYTTPRGLEVLSIPELLGEYGCYLHSEPVDQRETLLASLVEDDDLFSDKILPMLDERDLLNSFEKAIGPSLEDMNPIMISMVKVSPSSYPLASKQLRSVDFRSSRDFAYKARYPRRSQAAQVAQAINSSTSKKFRKKPSLKGVGPSDTLSRLARGEFSEDENNEGTGYFNKNKSNDIKIKKSLSQMNIEPVSDKEVIGNREIPKGDRADKGYANPNIKGVKYGKEDK